MTTELKGYTVCIPWCYGDPEQGMYHGYARAESEEEAQRQIAEEMAEHYGCEDEEGRLGMIEDWATETRGVDIYPARAEALNFIADLTLEDLIAEINKRGYRVTDKEF